MEQKEEEEQQVEEQEEQQEAGSGAGGGAGGRSSRRRIRMWTRRFINMRRLKGNRRQSGSWMTSLIIRGARGDKREE